MKTERDVLINAAKRLGLLMEEFTTKDEICISAYYELRIRFDDNGNIIEFDTHP